MTRKPDFLIIGTRQQLEKNIYWIYYHWWTPSLNLWKASGTLGPGSMLICECTLITATHIYLVYPNISLIFYRKSRMPQLEWFFRLRNLIISPPALIDLHWLSVTFRVQFKLLLFVYKSLHNQSPSYIKDLLSLKPAPYYALRSSAQSLLFVPKVNCSTLGIGPLLMLHLFYGTRCH